MFAAEETKKVKTVKKITPVRLKNIALYYLKRFDTTKAALRQVLLLQASTVSLVVLQPVFVSVVSEQQVFYPVILELMLEVMKQVF